MIVFAVRNPDDSKRAMLGMCYILDPDLSLPNKVIIMLDLSLNQDFTLVDKWLIAIICAACVLLHHTKTADN